MAYGLGSVQSSSFKIFLNPELNHRFSLAFWPNLEPNLRFRFSQVQFRLPTLNINNLNQSSVISSSKKEIQQPKT
jgi:hypothetical protein